jgi:TonB family protein
MRLSVFGVLLTLLIAPAAQSLAQQNEPVYAPGNGVTLPKATKTVAAQYTPEALQNRVQGEVLLTCVISKSGVPTQIEVTKSLEASLDAAAIKALEQWRFDPGTKDGEPVAVRIAVEMNFTLK